MQFIYGFKLQTEDTWALSGDNDHNVNLILKSEINIVNATIHYGHILTHLMIAFDRTLAFYAKVLSRIDVIDNGPISFQGFAQYRIQKKYFLDENSLKIFKNLNVNEKKNP